MDALLRPCYDPDGAADHTIGWPSPLSGDRARPWGARPGVGLGLGGGFPSSVFNAGTAGLNGSVAGGGGGGGVVRSGSRGIGLTTLRYALMDTLENSAAAGGHSHGYSPSRAYSSGGTGGRRRRGPLPRVRELFCLETACLLMEVADQVS